MPYTTHDLPPCPAFTGGITAKRAIIALWLSNGHRQTAPFEAVIDTGSDFCVFPCSFLDNLSLDWKNLKEAPALTHGGNIELRFAEIMASVRGLKNWKLLAGFSMQPCIPALGMIGFMDQFKVTFDQWNQFFEIESTDNYLTDTYSEHNQ